MKPSAWLRYNWQIAKQRLDAAKSDEAKWRLLLADAMLPANATVGRHTIDGLKITVGENISFATKDHLEIQRILEAALIQCPGERVNAVVSYKASFEKTIYDGLSAKAKKLVAPILLLKPAMVAIEDKDNK